MSEQTIFDKLAAPFPDEVVSWRVGSNNINKQTNEPFEGKKPQGMALAYIDARDVMRRFDAVCGPSEWQNDYPHAGAKTVCRIGVRVESEWIWKADGAGDTDVESEKGALSDAFKRAAVHWGVGRYLYDMDSPWVDLEKKGKTWMITRDARAKLDAAHRNYARKLMGELATGGSASAVARTVAADVEAGDEPGLEITDHRKDPLWAQLKTEIEKTCRTKDEVSAYWSRQSTLKKSKPHFAKAFHREVVLAVARSLPEAVGI